MEVECHSSTTVPLPGGALVDDVYRRFALKQNVPSFAVLVVFGGGGAERGAGKDSSGRCTCAIEK